MKLYLAKERLKAEISGPEKTVFRAKGLLDRWAQQSARKQQVFTDVTCEMRLSLKDELNNVWGGLKVKLKRDFKLTVLSEHNFTWHGMWIEA